MASRRLPVHTHTPPTSITEALLLCHQSISEGGVCSVGRGPRLPAGICGAHTGDRNVKTHKDTHEHTGSRCFRSLLGGYMSDVGMQTICEPNDDWINMYKTIRPFYYVFIKIEELVCITCKVCKYRWCINFQSSSLSKGPQCSCTAFTSGCKGLQP